MDRSLDEIAAEMRSPHELFEREYGEEGGDGVGPHRGHYHRSSGYRFSPYTTGHGPSWKSEMRRGEGEVGSKRLFVANLSYAVTWQRLKDFMRQGICLLTRTQTLISLGTRQVKAWERGRWQKLYIFGGFFFSAGPVDKCDIFSNPDGSSRVITNCLNCPKSDMMRSFSLPLNLSMFIVSLQGMG